jgi:hypothetical protein
MTGMEVNGWGEGLVEVTPFPLEAKPLVSRDISPLNQYTNRYLDLYPLKTP